MKRGLDRCEPLQNLWTRVEKDETTESNQLTVLFRSAFRRLDSESV
jgi:hypothetical protein